jgi:DNA-binding CsgD family transcriptional regulator
MVRSGLLGRDEPLSALVETVETARPALVIGEAGIGKTSLVRAAVSATGRRLYEGGGFATLSWLPYLALRRATGVPDLGSPVAVAGRVEREVGPDVLFLDDLQWLDTLTWSVLTELLGRVRFVGAVRLGDPGTAAAMTALERAGARPIRLEGLERGPSFDLAARSRPDRPAARLAGVVDESGGNPLLIEELALHGRRPAYLDRAIVAQLDDLPVLSGDVLRLHALSDRPIADGALDGAAAVAATDLAERGLLRVGPDGREIRHRIIAAAVLDGIDSDTRTALMREAVALARNGAGVRETVHTRRIRALDRSIAAGALRGAIRQADELLQQPMSRDARLRVATRRASTLGLLGRFDEAERELAGVEALTADDPACRLEAVAAATETAWWAGRPEHAIELAERAMAMGGGERIARVAALTRAWALCDLGRDTEPDANAGASAPGAIAAGAIAAERRALAARAAAEHDRAAAAFEAAAAGWTNVSLSRELLCAWAAADSRRLAGDPSGAMRDLEAVLARAESIGFEPLAARVRRSIRLAGGHVARRVEGDRTGVLTGREREVLTLVGRGLTNAEVARRMSVGRPTVARLLSNAMARLGADSRAHAVMLASPAG